MDFLISHYGFLLSFDPLLSIFLILLLTLVTGYLGSSLLIWTCLLAVIFFGLGVSILGFSIFLFLALVFNLVYLREILVTKPLMFLMKNFMPKISETERTALEAGVVWVE